MKLNDKFEGFIAAAYCGKLPRASVQFDDLKSAFFAGSLVTLGFLLESAISDDDQQHMVKLRELQNELKAYTFLAGQRAEAYQQIVSLFEENEER